MGGFVGLAVTGGGVGGDDGSGVGETVGGDVAGTGTGVDGMGVGF